MTTTSLLFAICISPKMITVHLHCVQRTAWRTTCQGVQCSACRIRRKQTVKPSFLSLTNITKHAGSATVDVFLQLDKNVISLSVRDYGKGISAERLAKMNGCGSDVGVGIAGMRERLKELGGRLEIESDSTGSLLKASIPPPKAV